MTQNISRQRIVCILVLGILFTTTSSLAQQSQMADSRPPVVDEQAQQLLARPVSVSLDRVDVMTAVRTLGRSAQIRLQFTADIFDVVRTPVTLHASNIPVGIAFERVLRGTPLHAVVVSRNVVEITRVNDPVHIMQGMIQGTVRDASTKLPLRGAKISVDGADRAESGIDGVYRVDVGSGSHTVVVKLLGYQRLTRTVVTQDSALVTIDLALTPAATTLDQVVVTGTIIPTALKAVPNAITVITAKQIEERGITKIDQLFRGDVPGLFAQNLGSSALLDEVTMFSRGATALSFSSAGVSSIGTTNPIKTYIDGVELADPQYLSQIDPKSIERIEILTGPQASTIYGSNAINGVMQVFTKRGTSNTPQLTLNLLSGWVENNFSSARTPQHDYNAQLSGVEGRLSYNAGGSWNYVGPWTPAKQVTRTGGFGGARLELPTPAGRVTADMSLRRTLTQSRQRGEANQTYAGYAETGWYVNYGNDGLDSPAMHTLTGQTLGLTFSYAPTAWWSHEFGLGQDASDTEKRVSTRGYVFSDDTTLYFSHSHTDRRSLRYATTARILVSALAQLAVTVGADSWQNLASNLVITPQTLTGSLIGGTGISRQPGHNTGGFVQSQLGLEDRLFFTYGLRAEWNPNFGEAAQPNYAPRYGVAYTQEVGPITVKLRGSYGRSTRPPQLGVKARLTIADAYGSYWASTSSVFLPYYGGVFDYQLANPDLGPEYQHGGEGGLELYLGTRGSLVITRYNQTVNGLIASPTVDSVRTLVPCMAFSPPCAFSTLDAQGYGYFPQYKYLNIGSIRNQGWELQGSVNVGLLTTRGTYSWTKSRTIGITPQYRAFFAGQPQYQVGAPFLDLPEHTWAFNVVYALASSSVGVNVTGTGWTRMTNGSNDFYFKNLYRDIRLLQNHLNLTPSRGRYVAFSAPYALADLNTSHRFASRFEGVLQVQNLMDRYTNDLSASYASMGRQVKLGLRLRTQ